jgi:hypothetical protein
MSEAVDNITERTHNVVILPPETGDRDVVTDEEDFGTDPNDVNQVEVAGEVELENELSTEEGDDEDDEPLIRWRKRPVFEKVWEEPDLIMSLESQFPILSTKSEYEDGVKSSMML